jgi:Tol biopolymer transport system component
LLNRHVGFLLTTASLLAAAAPAALAAGSTERVSVSSHGVQGDNDSGDFGGVAVSADGRFVAFDSFATDLVAGVAKGVDQVYVRDRKLGTTEQASVSSRGQQGDGDAGRGLAISPGGRFVAFSSFATDLVPGDTNRGRCSKDSPHCGLDVFVRDRKTGTTERVSLSWRGEQGDGDSGLFGVAISADGRFVAFDSDATNLVPGGTDGRPQIFVRDRKLGTTEQASVSSRGAKAGTSSINPSISADGRFVAFEWNVTNPLNDVFVRDRKLGKTERVSVSSRGKRANGGSDLPSISADGRFVAFESDATNLVPGDTNPLGDVFVHDRLRGTTERVSVGPGGVQADDGSVGPSISAHGRFVAFESDATNLVSGDSNGASDIFVRDRKLGKTERVSVSSRGRQGDGDSFVGAISADGRVVGFESEATDLVPGDTNGKQDVFVHIR